MIGGDGIPLRNTAHISTRNTSGISCARSYRTLRDGSFEDAFPGTSCQATIGVSLRDGLADASQRHPARERASNFVTPFVGPKKHPKLPLSSRHSSTRY